MKLAKLMGISVLAIGFTISHVQAADPAPKPKKVPSTQMQSPEQHVHPEDASFPAIRRFVEQMTTDNNSYVKNVSKEKWSKIAEDQNPQATVVSCSDSRVQSDAYHNNPINNLFYIRNIGNQIKSAEGSVEYGVNHLNTPILFIMGHSQCGAIHAAMGDYSKESKAIKSELASLDLIKGNDTDEGVIANIHNQVEYAVTKFKDKILKKNLTVIGAIYDFRNDFGHGPGKIIVIDVNGETDAERLKTLPILQGITDIAIGEKRLNPADVPVKESSVSAKTDAVITEKRSFEIEPEKTNFKFNFNFFKPKDAP